MPEQMCHYHFSPEAEHSCTVISIPSGKRLLGGTNPSAGAWATLETTEGGREVRVGDMLTLTVTINESFIRQSVDGSIAQRVIDKTKGHELMHAYDFSKKPLICLFEYIRDEILKNPGKEDALFRTLQQQYNKCVDALEARAVMSEVATFLHYHVKCRDNRETAYQILGPGMSVPIDHNVSAFLKENSISQYIGASVDEAELSVLNLEKQFAEQYASTFREIYSDSQLLLTALLEVGLLKGDDALIPQTGTQYMQAFEQHFADKAGLDVNAVAAAKFLRNESINFSVGPEGYIAPGTLDELLDDTKFDKLYKEYEATCEKIFERAKLTDKWWTHHTPLVRTVIK